MSKLFKKLKKGVSKLWKGVKKIFKKITSSTLGKILLAAAAIYVGGVMLGSWGGTGPLSFLSPATPAGVVAPGSVTIPTTGLGGGAGAGAAAGGEVVIGAEAATAAGGGAIGGEAVSVANIAAESAASSFGAGAAGSAVNLAPTIASASTGLAPGAVANAGFASTVGSASTLAGAAAPTLFQSIIAGVGKVGGWAAANPVPAAMMASGLASGLKKDPNESAFKYREKLLGKAYDNDELRKISIYGKTGDEQSILQPYGGTPT